MAPLSQPRADALALPAPLPHVARAFAFHATGLDRALSLRGVRGYRMERSFNRETGDVLVRLAFEPEYAFDWIAEARRFALAWLIDAGFYTERLPGSSTVAALRLTGYYGDRKALALPEPPASGPSLAKTVSSGAASRAA
jgi:hypothetical protein